MQSPIEYLNGINILKGDLLRKELSVFTFDDLLHYFPFRHVDKTRIDKIANIFPDADFAQVAGTIHNIQILGEKRGRRLVATLKDETGFIELIWFQGIGWVEKLLQLGKPFLAYGKVSSFMNTLQIAHPEIEFFTPDKAGGKAVLEPVYSTTEKLKARWINGRAFAKFTAALLGMLSEKDLPENLPDNVLTKYKLISRYQAYHHIHFPASAQHYAHAVRRIKFEELFWSQLRITMLKTERHRFSKGLVFDKVGEMFNTFFNHYIPFELTGAQKKVLKEIRKDTGSGKQMNRLLQGDVGSGKTMVALLSMLIATDNGYQNVLMAPTEILARQHYNNLKEMLAGMPLNIHLLTGSTKAKERRIITEQCADGTAHILIGTHAVIEEKVVFKNLGYAVIDEQHKFGVAQRAKLWKKNHLPPHVLVMTATPIPRTLALTAYGDLDYSIMDELPPGRKPITTVHRNETARPQVMHFLKEQIAAGRQAYVIYPLIEESSALDYENLMKGFEEVKAFFPEPPYYISMVHGRQKPEQKDTNMQRFVTNDTNILVGTTVIEVGVNVPNASVMVIESAEKFGLSQLHQLRGRVGRGAEQSFCILLTGRKISAQGRERLKIMVQTNDGFKIAEKDLELRGPGEMDGTKQSGLVQFKLANIVADKLMLEAARAEVELLLATDADFLLAENLPIKNWMQKQKGKTIWSKIA
ncbi:MAG: ATP-dependent DNA helicase RecG [Ferruginibacter sp.]